MNLTPAQHAAAFDRAAENVVLTSGAGCGKTAVLARRFTQLLITHPDRKNPLAHFVALTFTDKAAMEMRDRVGSMLRELASQAAGEDRVRIRQWLDYLPEARIMTIHSFCRQLLRTYAVDIGLDPAFTVLADELVVAELLHQAIHETLVAHLDAGQEDTAGLMTELGFDQLAKGMKWLIEQRTAVGLDDIPSSADLLSHWHDCQQALGDAKWQELIDGGIVEQLEDILAIPCHNEADKLNRFRAEKIALARTLIQSPADRTAAALQEVAKSPGGIGSAKAWGDKDTVKAVRQTLKDTLGPLGEMALYAMDMGPADEGAARALSHLMALAADANTRFTHAKAMRGGLDFTDLLHHAERLLDDPHIRRQVASQIDQLLIDECQDTDAQQMRMIWSLAMAADKEDSLACKLCLIGDVKQSIYRFRGADVSVFNELCNRLGRDAIIRLDESFRTHDAGVAFINDLFAPMMDGYQAISAHRQDVPPEPSVELLLAGVDSNDADTATDAQAELAAQRIAAMVRSGEHRVFDRHAGSYRPVRYGDIAVLFARMTKSLRFERALAARDIPYYVVGGTGFFHQQEVYDVLNLLSVIHDPTDDLAFVGVARSAMVGLDDNVLLHLARCVSRPYAMATSTEALAGHISPPDYHAVEELIAWVHRWHARKDRVDLATMIDSLLMESGYEASLLAQPHGKRKVGNVQLLVEHARQASLEGMPLASFIARLSELTLSESRHEQSASAAEADDVVRLMTVHKAKGLDFPVVVVPDLNAATGQATGLIRHRRDWGVTLKRLPAGLQEGDDGPAISVELPKALDQEDDHAEAIRKYYVALTRHEDHLILIGANKRLKTGQFDKGCFLDLIARRTFLASALEALSDNKPEQLVPYGPDGRYNVRCSLHWPEASPRPRDTKVSPGRRALREVSSAAEFVDSVSAFTAGSAPPELGPLPASVGKAHLAVTSLGDFAQCPRHFQWRYELAVPGALVAYLPDLPPVAPSAVDAATAGTFFHRCMELTDFTSPESPARTAAQAAAELELPPEASAVLAQEFVEQRAMFEQTSLWARAVSATSLQRELDFEVDLGQLILRGQIDLLLADRDGQWHIVDYKSDQIADTTPAALAAHSEHHRQQMLVYAIAASAHLQVPAVGATLYYLRAGQSHTYAFTPDDLNEGRNALAELASTLITARRTGEFAPCPSNACAWCDYRRLCPAAQ